MEKAIHYKTKGHQSNLISHEKKTSIRLNKYLSDAGICSRRGADKLVEEGRVMIDGEMAVVGSQILPHQKVFVDSKLVPPKATPVYIALHKPKGIVCTNDQKVAGNIRDYVDYKELIFPIGRLDKDSHGLILLTNDGDIVNKILRAEYGHEKEYVVKVNKYMTDEFLTQMSSGVIIYNQVAHKNQKTTPTQVLRIDDDTFRIFLKQGLNKQIRRMCEALGYHVEDLKRTRIMNIKLGDLPSGYWRYLEDSELKELNHLINLS